jgi:predicted nucleotidyltransferase
MATADEIVRYVERIVTTFKPHRVVLFGSYAHGAPTADSDVDLLITRRRWSMSPLTAAGRIRTELGVPFAMDLIVRSEADIARRIAWKDCFVLEIMEKGITLYAADHPRVGSQGRVRLRRRLRSAAVTQEIAAR